MEKNKLDRVDLERRARVAIARFLGTLPGTDTMISLLLYSDTMEKLAEKVVEELFPGNESD